MANETLGFPSELVEYGRAHGPREDDVLAKLRTETAAHPMAIMQISPEMGGLLRMLCLALQATRVIELGTFTGYSSVVFAQAVGETGTVVCCDSDPEATAIARRYWKLAGVEARTDLRLAPALETLDALIAAGAEPFDLAFVDADKQLVNEYAQRCRVLLRPGGLLVVDNVYRSGKVTDPAIQDPSVTAMQRLIASARDADAAILPIGDGVLIWRN